MVADDTLNVKELPEMGAEPEERVSVIAKTVVMTAGAVTTKVYSDPPPTDVSEATPDPEGPYVGTEKSKESAVVVDAASLTVTVQESNSPIRTTVVERLVCPVQDRTEAAVGVPSTAKAKELPVIDAAVLSVSVMRKVAVITLGAVTTNPNENPPFGVAIDGAPEPDGPYVGALKSPGRATAIELASRGVITQVITSLTRT